MQQSEPTLPVELFRYLALVLPNGRSLGIEPYLKVLSNFLQRLKRPFVSTGTFFQGKSISSSMSIIGIHT